jgi:hypothetical protein
LAEASVVVLHEQRWEVGTPAITWSTCWPQPAHVVLEQERQFTGRHMLIDFPSRRRVS